MDLGTTNPSSQSIFTWNTFAIVSMVGCFGERSPIFHALTVCLDTPMFLANEKEANATVQPTVRPNESSVALGGAKAPSVNSILQKVLDVKQGKGHGQHSPFWWV